MGNGELNLKGMGIGWMGRNWIPLFPHTFMLLFLSFSLFVLFYFIFSLSFIFLRTYVQKGMQRAWMMIAGLRWISWVDQQSNVEEVDLLDGSRTN